MNQLCHSCRNIRVGQNNDGDTVPEAMEGIGSLITSAPSIALQMMEAMIPQAIKGGLCQTCANDLQTMKIELRDLLAENTDKSSLSSTTKPVSTPSNQRSAG